MCCMPRASTRLFTTVRACAELDVCAQGSQHTANPTTQISVLRACSNANPGDFQGTESPPWSPRRVPPAHLWGEGPPRHPGYRSGGATLPCAPEGDAHAHHACHVCFEYHPTAQGHRAYARHCLQSCIVFGETWESTQRIPHGSGQWPLKVPRV